MTSRTQPMVAMIGAVYGAFVEIDDASGEDAKALAASREKAPAKQLKKG